MLLFVLVLMMLIAQVEGAVRSCAISYPLGLRSATTTSTNVIDYKVTDTDMSGNLIVGGTCLDPNICGTGSNPRIIFEYITTGTLAYSWTLYLRKSASSTDLEPTDIMSLKASPKDALFVAAIKHVSNNRVAFMRIPTAQGTPTI